MKSKQFDDDFGDGSDLAAVDLVTPFPPPQYIVFVCFFPTSSLFLQPNTNMSEPQPLSDIITPTR